VETSFAALVWSDYRSHLEARKEPAWSAALKLLPRLLVNPSLQFALLVRIAQKGPRALQYPVRWLQIAIFSSEVYWFQRTASIELGPGVTFPHPIGVLIGPGTRIGSGVTIYNNTQIGTDRHWTLETPNERVPTIGDRVVIYAYTSIQGPWDIGDDAVVGTFVLVDEDVPPGALKTRALLKLAGEWPGERR
jgi:serine O-acetyltransferase